ncbi:MAG: S26 family signal peptidase [Euryarchaeota archaeon]|jgi:nickel-type superoxide dismutase maturation protease|nr:S26 family signal peptidase [Euryarchaeota archaeon]
MKKNLQVVVSGHSMWPNLNDGQVIECQIFKDQELSVGDVIVFKHPFNSKLVMIKRIGKINSDDELWVVGDNPDPTSSEDSHNFGFISKNHVLGLHCE